MLFKLQVYLVLSKWIQQQSILQFNFNSFIVHIQKELHEQSEYAWITSLGLLHALGKEKENEVSIFV